MYEARRKHRRRRRQQRRCEWPASTHPEHATTRTRSARQGEERRRRGHPSSAYWRHCRALQLLHLLHLQIAPLLLMKLAQHHHAALAMHLLQPLLLHLFAQDRFVPHENIAPLLLEARAELLELLAERCFVLRVLQREPVHLVPCGSPPVAQLAQE
jgi:hypothetical protein